MGAESLHCRCCNTNVDISKVIAAREKNIKKHGKNQKEEQVRDRTTTTTTAATRARARARAEMAEIVVVYSTHAPFE